MAAGWLLTGILHSLSGCLVGCITNVGGIFTSSVVLSVGVSFSMDKASFFGVCLCNAEKSLLLADGMIFSYSNAWWSYQYMIQGILGVGM